MTGIPGAHRRLGEFELEEELGRGGMGIVYRARQLSAGGRLVALKVLPSLIGGDAACVERFRREATAAGRIDHPGIVPVFAVGEADGVHYFAMDLIDGPSLDRLLDALADREPVRLAASLFEESGFDQVLPRLVDPEMAVGTPMRFARSCARLARSLAEALAIAHREGIIHRDVKPSNVLLRSSGRPVLVDFGLARDQSSLGITQSGDAVGTPAYMSPEQALGSKAIDGRVDVYGLGATLFEMLTLRPPFHGAHPTEIMRRIVDEVAPDVRTINARVPAELASIVERALRRDPDRRYPTVDAMALDLDAFLDGRALSRAGRRTPLQVSRLVGPHRRRLRTGLMVGVALTIAIATIGLVTTQHRARSGHQALADARACLLDGFRVARAEASYGRASAFLDSETVRAARVAHVREVFDAAYRRAQFTALVEYLESSFTADDQSAEWWQVLHDRALGRGRIELQAPKAAAVELVPLHDGSPDPSAALAFVPGASVPVGTYLARISAPDQATTVSRVDVVRDDVAVLRALRVPTARLPDGMLVVPDGDAGFAIGRAEMTDEEFRRLVAEVDDRELRDELLAGVSRVAEDGRASDLPARGLSWRTARAIAALAGGHLPSRDEYVLAMTAGIPSLVYGYGDSFAWDRIIAAPGGALRAPRAAADSPSACSPHGLQNGVGNVAELLGDDSTAARFAVGGGYLDDRPEALRIDAERSLAVDESRADVGLRMARFLSGPDDGDLAERLGRSIELAAAAGSTCAIAEWRLDASSDLEWAMRLEDLDVNALAAARTFAVPGYRIVARRDDAGTSPRASVELADASGLHAPIEVRIDPRFAEGRSIGVAARLRPIAGLVAVGAHHVLRIPFVDVSGVRSWTRVRLLPGSRVESCDPQPTMRGTLGGAPELVFESDPASADTPRFATVEFRVDGSLATNWPAFGAGERDLRAALAQSVPAAQGFRVRTVDDVTAVGGVMSVFARVDRIGGTAPPLEGWPIRVLFERRDARWQLLGALPLATADRGEVVGDAYRSERLGVTVPIPAGARVERLCEGPFDMQLALTPSGPDRAASRGWIAIRGFRSDPPAGGTDDASEIGREAALAWLIGADPFSDDPDPVDFGRAVPGTVGRVADPAVCSIFERVATPVAGGGFRQERWYFVERGSRFLLLTCIASGATAVDARTEFEGADLGWFRSVLDGLALDDPARGPDPGRR